jgi:NADH-quinone oxidoreductase subunit N
MASAVKVAGFAAIIRVFVLTFDQYRTDWQPIIYVLAVLSLLVGAFLAVVQTNVKRMLAYSSVSHAGFMLVGVQAATDRGTAAVVFYLAAYSFMVIGSFGVLSVASNEGEQSLESLRGLAKRSPFLAFAMMVFLLSQAGVPATTGFFAKFGVIGAAIEARSFWLAMVAMGAAVVAAYMYLRIIVAMFFSDADEGEPADEAEADTPDVALASISVPPGAAIAIGICLVVTVVFGVWPGPIDDLARAAIPRLVAESSDFLG